MSSPARRIELSRDKWCEKSKLLRLELDRNKICHAQLKQSRDSWRQKAHTSAAKVTELETELKQSRKKKNVNSVEFTEYVEVSSSNLERHRYSVEAVEAAVRLKLETSASFHAVVDGLGIVASVYSLSEFPHAIHHSTLITWIKKIGYYELTKSLDKRYAWIIIIDESVQIGQVKLLVIQGIRVIDLPADRALQLTDLQTLFASSATSWSGDKIAEALVIVKERVGEIAYAVSDNGSNIKKALKKEHIIQVHDITHHIALIIKSLYHKDEQFVAFTGEMGRIKKRGVLGKAAAVLPPNQRTKSRFLNINLVAKWGQKALENLLKNTNLTVDHHAVLDWVKPYDIFIAELQQITDAADFVNQTLKNKGLNAQTATLIIAKFDDKSNPATGKLLGFQNRIKKYLTAMLALLPANLGKDSLLCCSDCIESTFGKFKQWMSINTNTGITDLALVIPAFSVPITPQYITTAFTAVKVKDVKEWITDHFEPSFFAQRRTFLNATIGTDASNTA